MLIWMVGILVWMFAWMFVCMDDVMATNEWMMEIGLIVGWLVYAWKER
jgi:hypothetical protein